MAKGFVITDIPASMCPWLRTAFRESSDEKHLNSGAQYARRLGDLPSIHAPGSPISVINSRCVLPSEEFSFLVNRLPLRLRRNRVPLARR